MGRDRDVQLRHDYPVSRPRDMRSRVAALFVAWVILGAVATLLVTTTIDDDAVAGELPAMAKRMRAFTSSPGLDPFEVPVTVSSAFARMTAAGGYGAYVSEQVRLLRTSLGVSGAALYAAPTTEGAMCFIVNEVTYVGTCADRFPSASGNMVLSLYTVEGSPFSVVGLVPDDVTAVEVVIDGQRRPASLSHNVLFWQSAQRGVGEDDLDAVRARQIDGSWLTVDAP